MANNNSEVVKAEPCKDDKMLDFMMTIGHMVHDHIRSTRPSCSSMWFR
jgi:hypothetical protein